MRSVRATGSADPHPPSIAVTLPSYGAGRPETFLGSLQPVGSVQALDPVARAEIQEAAEAIEALPDVTRATLAGLIHQHPEWVPILADCCRLSRGKLKSALVHGLGTAGWVTLARKQPDVLIDILDDRFDLVAEVEGAANEGLVVRGRARGAQSARSNPAGSWPLAASIGRRSVPT